MNRNASELFTFDAAGLIALLSHFWTRGYVQAVVEDMCEDEPPSPMNVDSRDEWIRETYDEIQTMLIYKNGKRNISHVVRQTAAKNRSPKV